MKRKRIKHDKRKRKNEEVGEHFDREYSLKVILGQIKNEADRVFFMNIKNDMTNKDVDILHEEIVTIMNAEDSKCENPYIPSGPISENPITSALKYINRRILARKTEELKGEVAIKIKNRTLNTGCSPDNNIVLRCIQNGSIDLLYYIDNNVRMFNWNYDNNLYLFFCIRECKRLDILNFLLNKSNIKDVDTFNLMIEICLKNKDYAKIYVLHDNFDQYNSNNPKIKRYPIEVLLNLKFYDIVIDIYKMGDESKPWYVEGDECVDKLEMVIDVFLNDGQIDKFYKLIDVLEYCFDLYQNPMDLTVTPLIRAINKKMVKCANVLIEKFKIDLTACDGKLLTLAAACGDFKLFMKFVNEKIPLNINNNEPILEACRNDNTDIVMFLSSKTEVDFKSIAYYCLDQCLSFSSYFTTFFMLTTPELMSVLELKEVRDFILIEYKNCVKILHKMEGRERKYPDYLNLVDTVKKENNLLRKLNKSLEPQIKLDVKKKRCLVVILLKLILLQNFDPMNWNDVINEVTLMLKIIKHEPKGSQWYLTMKNKNDMVKFILEKYVKFYSTI